MDIAIVGGGVAGLRAADIIARSGLSVTVLEARDRIGGRLLSPDRDGHFFDLGASWFWGNEPLVNGIVADEGLEAFAQHLAGDALFQTDDGVQRLQGNQLDAPSGRLREGTASIARALYERLPPGTVKLDSPVRSIALDGSDLRLRTPSEDVSASQALLALPPALVAESIDLGPLLSPEEHRLCAITPVWMGGSVKAVAHYRRPFWRDRGLAGSAFSYTGPLGELHDMSGPDGSPAAIFGFARPGAGEPTPTSEQVIAQLVTLFGPDAAKPLEVLIQDWRNEEFTSPSNVTQLGSYQLFGHPTLQAPVGEGRVHFCSTETAHFAPGHIEGALVAAERAAGNALSYHASNG